MSVDEALVAVQEPNRLVIIGEQTSRITALSPAVAARREEAVALPDAGRARLGHLRFSLTRRGLAPGSVTAGTLGRAVEPSIGRPEKISAAGLARGGRAPCRRGAPARLRGREGGAEYV